MEKRMVPFVSKGCNFTRQWLLDEIDFLPPTHCTFVSDEAAGLRAGAQRQHCLTCKISHHRKLPPLAAGRVSHEISLDSLCLATDRSTFVLTFRGREWEFIIAGRLDCFQVSQVPLLSCSDIHCREPDYHQVLLSILTLTARLGFL